MCFFCCCCIQRGITFCWGVAGCRLLANHSMKWIWPTHELRRAFSALKNYDPISINTFWLLVAHHFISQEIINSRQDNIKKHEWLTCFFFERFIQLKSRMFPAAAFIFAYILFRYSVICSPAIQLRLIHVCWWSLLWITHYSCVDYLCVHNHDHHFEILHSFNIHSAQLKLYNSGYERRHSWCPTHQHKTEYSLKTVE